MGIFRDRKKMMEEASKVLKLINPRFVNYDTNVRNLSGGQRQAIAIARAVYFNARVLILDEPTAALGPRETELFKELVARLKTQGVGIVLISHDIHDVFDLADRLVVMANGRVVGRLNTHEATKGKRQNSEPTICTIDLSLHEPWLNNGRPLLLGCHHHAL